MKKNIVLTGGGTLGSVTPLLAFKQAFEKTGEYTFTFIGTRKGVEKDFIQKTEPNIIYKWIFSGKFRRYISYKTILDPAGIKLGFIQSLFYFLKNKPAAVITAGSYVSVPVIIAARIFKIPIIVHQMDIKVGLANKIMARFANIINISFKENKKDFKHLKNKEIIHLGNPIRQEIFKGSKKKSIDFYKLNPKSPTLLVVGGGTGSHIINEFVEDNHRDLLKEMNVILISGKQKSPRKPGHYTIKDNRYIIEELVQDNLENIYAVADLVVTRAGLGALYELLALEKPVFVLPIKNSQQEDNAELLHKNEIGEIFHSHDIDSGKLLKEILKTIKNKKQLAHLSEHASHIIKKDAADKLSEYMIKEMKINSNS